MKQGTMERGVKTNNNNQMESISLLPLRNKWVGYEKELLKMLTIIQGNPDWATSMEYLSLMQKLYPHYTKWVGKDLRGAPLAKVNLKGADLTMTDLTEVELKGANLEETDLQGAMLTKANLEGACLLRANLWQANLSQANLIQSNLEGANLMQTKLSGARLITAKLLGATLVEADLSEANLWGAQLSGASLRGANLSGANLGMVEYTTDEIFNRLTKWYIPKFLHNRKFLNGFKFLQKWRPVTITDFLFVDASRIDGSRNPVLKRHIEDFQFINGFKEKSWLHKYVFFWLWKITSDCGRSLLLWLVWSIFFVGLFAFVYSLNLKGWFKPGLDCFNALYFSVVTFTTLGFGDLTPNLSSRTAQGIVMIQVIIGYIMLGGLVSILANKLARRA